MAFYQMFTSANTNPDPAALVSSLRATIDATIGLAHDLRADTFTLKKGVAWTAAQITAAQGIIDAAPPLTPQRIAQNQIDNWSIGERALVLTLIDQLNVLRAALPAPLPAITPAQALAAVRAKAGTLA